MSTTSKELTLQPTQEPSVALMLQTMVEKGITADNAAAMTQLMDLHERMQDRDAERQFNAAFVKLQSEIPVIVATSVIPNRGKYERFEDVMRQIQPALTANGFSVSFSQSFTETRIIETCHLKHAAGHSHPNSFGVRLGGKADSETQADCKASTTAKRNALLNALNIVIRQDVMQSEDDGANDGGYITKEQAQKLQSRVLATRSNEAKFLSFALQREVDAEHPGSFEEIPVSMLGECDRVLSKREEERRA